MIRPNHKVPSLRYFICCFVGYICWSPNTVTIWIRISNGFWQNGGHLSRFRIPLKIRTVWNPTSFQPFKIQTSPDFRSPLYSHSKNIVIILLNWVSIPIKWSKEEKSKSLGLGGSRNCPPKGSPDMITAKTYFENICVPLISDHFRTRLLFTFWIPDWSGMYVCHGKVPLVVKGY